MALSHLFDVLIIGGGYTGAALAVRLSREAGRALSVGVIEPREDVGRGVAYTDVHPENRLNGPDAVHIVLPDRPTDFPDWLQRNGLLETDAGGRAGTGAFFARRADFGRYMAELFQAHQAVNG
ncbi:MAG: FAD/NAD(P)-binding protein, partial [Rhodospirillales bacterium]|nr:FAD/NAD(P)-binding protein [Rhodospirillales bacterium]